MKHWKSKKKVEKNEGAEDDLDVVRRNMATAAGEVVRHTKAEREKNYIMSTPESVRRRAEVATRCTANI